MRDRCECDEPGADDERDHVDFGDFSDLRDLAGGDCDSDGRDWRERKCDDYDGESECDEGGRERDGYGCGWSGEGELGRGRSATGRRGDGCVIMDWGLKAWKEQRMTDDGGSGNCNGLTRALGMAFGSKRLFQVITADEHAV